MKDNFDYYNVLEVPRYASIDEIKSAYRTLAKRSHPDVSGTEDAQMARLNRAFEVLSDPHRRQEYDASFSVRLTELTAWLPMGREAVDARWVKTAAWWLAAALVLWLCHSPVDLPLKLYLLLR